MSMRYLLVFCLCSCIKQTDIQKVYNCILRHKTTQECFDRACRKHSDIGFALVYDKENEKMDLRNTYRISKTFDNIRYNKMSSDDTQMCLELFWFIAQINSHKWRFTYARQAIKSRLTKLSLTSPPQHITKEFDIISKISDFKTKLSELSEI
mgnify:FL=1